MQSEALLVPQSTSLESKTYPKPNESYGQNIIFLSFLKKFKGIAMKFKKKLHDRFDMKTKTLKILYYV